MSGPDMLRARGITPKTEWIEPAPGGYRISSDFVADVPLAEADTFFGSVLTCLVCGQTLGPVRNAAEAEWYARRHRVQKHYQTWPTPENFIPDICAVFDCDRVAQVKGFCDAHYRQVKRHKGILAGKPLRPTEIAPCSVEDCWRLSVNAGLCSKHAAKAKAGYAF